jgi:(S)-2-hydroxyglutarate dehydrogenase
VPFRGAWLELRPGLRHLVRGNVYPVPAGAGCRSSGCTSPAGSTVRVWIGPNAVLAGAREGARPWSLSARDLAEVVRFGGRGGWRAPTSASPPARCGATGAAGDGPGGAALRAGDRSVRDVRRGPWGVRAQLVAPDGRLVDDFTIRASGRVLHVLNAPSPAATAALAIGEDLAGRVLGRLEG